MSKKKDDKHFETELKFIFVASTQQALNPIPIWKGDPCESEQNKIIPHIQKSESPGKFLGTRFRKGWRATRVAR